MNELIVTGTVCVVGLGFIIKRLLSKIGEKDNEIIYQRHVNRNLVHELTDARSNNNRLDSSVLVRVRELEAKLSKANNIIRTANCRINDLKFDLLMDSNTSGANPNAGKKNKVHERDPYEVLGLKSGASQEEIRKNYKRLSSVFHPDRSGNNQAMQKINDAYNKLKA